MHGQCKGHIRPEEQQHGAGGGGGEGENDGKRRLAVGLLVAVAYVVWFRFGPWAKKEIK